MATCGDDRPQFVRVPYTREPYVRRCFFPLGSIDIFDPNAELPSAQELHQILEDFDAANAQHEDLVQTPARIPPRKKPPMSTKVEILMRARCNTTDIDWSVGFAERLEAFRLKHSGEPKKAPANEDRFNYDDCDDEDLLDEDDARPMPNATNPPVQSFANQPSSSGFSNVVDQQRGYQNERSVPGPSASKPLTSQPSAVPNPPGRSMKNKHMLKQMRDKKAAERR
ncbi:hypothetical protein M3Y99_01397000 [Aphelenchoides fujianensis]|nr:hypothetical protein M3Y99_01397000 [Aphelenchoides fujianensis]